MKIAQVSVGLAIIHLLASCQQRLPQIPEGTNLIGLAVEGEDAMSCDWFHFTLDSLDSSTMEQINLYGLGPPIEWSTDGNWVAYIDDGGYLQILEADDWQPVGDPFLPGDETIKDITWSNDSMHIAYETMDKRIGWVDVSCIQGGYKCEPMGNILHSGEDPTFSPDGRNVAFSWDPKASSEVSSNRIYILELGAPHQLTRISGSRTNCHDPDWSPVGDDLVFECEHDIYIADLRGEDPKNLTKLDGENPPWWPADELPRWSLDGEYITFLSDRQPGGMALDICLSDARENAIYAMLPDGSDVKPISALGDFEIHWYTWIR